jgi:2-oxoglutarate dehydrogenase E1 component
MKLHPNAKIYWCQEEHKNMGAFEYAKQRIRTVCGWERRVNYAGRHSAAAAATGSKQGHLVEHKRFMDMAFKELD